MVDKINNRSNKYYIRLATKIIHFNIKCIVRDQEPLLVIRLGEKLCPKLVRKPA